MDTNTKLIWTNRVLNLVAVVSGIMSGLVGVLAMIGDVVKTLEGQGLIPNKWLGLAGVLGTIGMIAAKYSKTPSQAMAAAVPPSKKSSDPDITPVIKAGVIVALIGAMMLSGCATTSKVTTPVIATVKDCANEVTHSVALGILNDVTGALVCEGGDVKNLPACVITQLGVIAKTAGWVAIDCAIAEIQSKTTANLAASSDATEQLILARANLVAAGRANGTIK